MFYVQFSHLNTLFDVMPIHQKYCQSQIFTGWILFITTNKHYENTIWYHTAKSNKINLPISIEGMGCYGIGINFF